MSGTLAVVLVEATEPGQNEARHHRKRICTARLSQSGPMTEWDARASAILREHATKVAVYSIAVSMVFWLASRVKKHCCAQQQSLHAYIVPFFITS